MTFRTIAIACALIGALLTLFIYHWIGNYLSFVRPEWYESEYLPLWVASAVAMVLAMWGRLSTGEAIASGLLVTAPPYGWYAAVVLYEYMYGESAFTIAECVRLMTKVGILAVSGGALNPLLSTLTRMIRKRVQDTMTG